MFGSAGGVWLSRWPHCRLEPAGSHGCWGLDDYQFLPYLWGSGQLLGNPLIQPSSIHSDQIVNTYADEYLYLGCIRFIRQASHGILRGHIGSSHKRSNASRGLPRPSCKRPHRRGLPHACAVQTQAQAQTTRPQHPVPNTIMPARDCLVTLRLRWQSRAAPGSSIYS